MRSCILDVDRYSYPTWGDCIVQKPVHILRLQLSRLKRLGSSRCMNLSPYGLHGWPEPIEESCARIWENREVNNPLKS
jgi:hypothetical protein